MILGLAAGPDFDIRRKALQYFFDNFNAKYAAVYTPKDVAHLPFVPAIRADGTAFLAKPGEVRLGVKYLILLSLINTCFHRFSSIRNVLFWDSPS